MKGRNCSEQILTLETVTEVRKALGQANYCVLIDIKKAFDSVDRNMLFETVLDLEVRRKTVTMLNRMYDGKKSMTLMNGTPSKPIESTRV